MKEQKSIGEMTTRELKKYIRKQVKKANTRLKNLAKRKKGVSRAVTEELDYLRKLGIINKKGKAVTGYRTATKVEMQKKARELEYFNDWKGSETEAIAAERDYKKYQAFIQNPENSKFKDYSYTEWKDLVTTFGAMEDKLKDFEYEDMKQLHLESTQQKSSIDFLSAMVEAKRKSKTGGTQPLTTMDLTDLVRSELFNGGL